MTRAALLLVALAGCDGLVGIHDIGTDGAAGALAFHDIPGGVAGQPLGRILVDALDVAGRPVPSFEGEVTLSLGANPGGAHLLGKLTTRAVNGTAAFQVIGVDQPATGLTLVATVTGVPPATSGAFDIIAPTFTRVPIDRDGGTIASVVVSPSGAVFASTPDGVYSSSDAAAHWQPPGFGADLASTRLHADPHHPGVIYAHEASGTVHKTEDSGVTWFDVASWDLAPKTYGFAIDPSSLTLYAAEGNAVRRSDDGGTTWTVASMGGYDQLAVDATSPDVLYARRFGGRLHVSTDRGASFLMTAVGEMSQAQLMLAAPTGMFVSERGVVRSTDHGTTWTPVYNADATAMAYAPSQPNRVYLFASDYLAVSDDGGATFANRGPIGTTVRGLAVDPTNPDRVYAGTVDGMLASSNAGTTWAPASTGIAAPAIDSIAVPSATGAVISTVTRRALARTTNGTTWSKTSADGVSRTVFADPSTNKVYACAGNYFATSVDGGATFTTGETTGLRGPCKRLVIAGTTMYLASAGALFRSTTAGAAWTVLPQRAEDVALGDRDGTTLLVTDAGSVQRSSNAATSFAPVVMGTGLSVVSEPPRVIAGSCLGIHVSIDGGAHFADPTTSTCVLRLIKAGSRLYAVGDKGRHFVLMQSTDGGQTWTTSDLGGVPAGLSITALAASEDGATLYVGTDGGLFKYTP